MTKIRALPALLTAAALVVLTAVAAPQQADTSLYAPHVNSDRQFSQRGYSECPATMTVKVPFGKITSVAFSYDVICVHGDHNDYVTEIRCVSSGRSTGVMHGVPGGAHAFVSGIADGLNDSAVFELHVGRSKYGSKCAGFIYAVNWTAVTSYDDALPIGLTAFGIECVPNALCVSWRTASETNCAYYCVYGSYDGDAWERAATVPCESSASFETLYETALSRPYAYVKLIRRDADGAAEKYAPVRVSCPTSATRDPYPNPTPGRLTVPVESGTADVAGILSSTKVKFSDFAIDLSGMPRGIYVVTVGGRAYRVVKL